MKLTSIDGLILLVYVMAVLGIGGAVRSRMKTSRDFLLTGRNLPLWICALALAGAGISAPEIVAMGALGARYGLEAAHFYGIACIPAMLLLGLFLMPLYYGSKARSVPDFLRLRFDARTRTLTAVLFAVTTLFSSAISMVAIARLMQALHIFDGIFAAVGRPPAAIFAFSIVLSALIVLGYVLAGGLESAMHNQVLQFCTILAGLLPVVLLGLRNIGGWAGLKASLPAPFMQQWKGIMHSTTNPMGIEIAALTIGLGFVLGAGYWCTDFRVIQNAMAAPDVETSSMAPILAAIPRMLFPFLVILPGLMAIALPTPRSVTTVTRNPDGSIVHNIQVVSPQAEQGKGLVPARIDPATGQPVLTAAGQPVLDYDMATPNMLLHFLPTGLLGLGLTALLASFMSGMAANVTAFNTIFTCDLYQSHIRKDAGDRHYLVVARWAAAGFIALSIAAAFAAARCDSLFDAIVLLFSIVNAPLLAAILLGMFSRRATGHGAFSGLLAGTAVALLHHGLALPVEARPGIQGGWITILHRYPSAMAQNLWGAILAFTAAFIVIVVVSLGTRPRPASELVGLVYSLTPRPAHPHAAWWQRPETLGIAILLAAIALNLFFA